MTNSQFTKVSRERNQNFIVGYFEVHYGEIKSILEIKSR